MYSNSSNKNHNVIRIQQMTKSNKTDSKDQSSIDKMRESISRQIKDIENKIKEIDQNSGGFRSA